MIVTTTTGQQTIEMDEGTFTNAVEVWATYRQVAFKLRKKWYGNDDANTDSGIEIENDTVIVTFSQNDTKNMRHELPMRMQLKWLDSEGNVDSSEIVPFDVGEILDDELMEGVSDENDS